MSVFVKRSNRQQSSIPFLAANKPLPDIYFSIRERRLAFVGDVSKGDIPPSQPVIHQDDLFFAVGVWCLEGDADFVNRTGKALNNQSRFHRDRNRLRERNLSKRQKRQTEENL